MGGSNLGQGYSAHLIHIDVNVCSLAVVIADFVALLTEYEYA